MYFKILMILGALFGFLYSFRISSSYPRAITWAAVLAVGVIMIQNPTIAIDGYYLFALTQIGILVYGFSSTEFSNLKKGVLFMGGACTLIPLALLISGSPLFVLVSLLCAVVQLAVFIYALTKIILELKDELGFLVIISLDALIRLIAGIMFYTVSP